MSAPSVALTPLESLCYEQISFWVGVVEKNRGRSGRLVAGRPWTRLPAADLVSDLQDRFTFLAVTLRQVRRALKRLVELGLVVREQFWQAERWRSDYWYSLPETASLEKNPEVPETVTPQVPISEHRGDPEVAPGLRTLPSTLPEQNRQAEVKKEEGQPPASPVNGEQTPTPPVVPLETPGDSVIPSGGSQGLSGPSGSVWGRIRALAAQFDPGSLEPVSPRAVVVGNRTLHVADGACAPLR